ncbi:hypothetical protein BGZ83_000604 [Gryganskiella cystojenkinii]|nr:hypothetical protein BGZ83_000604 [Gryganskiella cystojenkinii]
MTGTETLAEFNCSASFAQHARSYPAILRFKANELTWTIRGTDISSRLPYSCVYGYQAPDAKHLDVENQDVEDLVKNSLQDLQITLHYVEFTSQDLKAAASASRAQVHFLFLEREDVKRFLTLARELNVFPKSRRVLVLVNPNGGIRIAKKICDTVVKPMMTLSGLDFKEQYTEYGKHAIDIAHKIDLEQVDAILVVSGDGVLHEVINGLLSRPDWDRARRLPVGIIPAGSGNAFATSIDRPRLYAMLLFSWGMMADSDIESDKFRWLGSLRFEIAGFIRVLRLRRYPGKVYVLPPKHNREIASKSSSTESQHAPATGYPELLESSEKDKEPPKPWRLLPNMPFYSMLLLLNCPSAAETTFFSNSIRFNDGIMRLWYSCETRFWRIMLPFLLDQTNGKLVERGLMQDTECGGILIIPGVEGKPDDSSTHEVIDPDYMDSNEAKDLRIHRAPGYFDVDGEVMPTTRTLIEILPSFMEILVPDWYHHEGEHTDEAPEAMVAKRKRELVRDVARTRQVVESKVWQAGGLLVAIAVLLTSYALFFSEPFQIWAGLARRK